MVRIVDVHAHFYPRDYLTLLQRIVEKERTSPWGKAVQLLMNTRLLVNPKMVDISAHIDDMDKAGVEVQVLSLSIPHLYFDEERDAAEAAHIVNDTIAEMCAKYPTRFKGLAVLPLPHTEAALKELDRAINTLKLHGMTLGGNLKGVYLDDERVLPIYREANRLRLTIHLHPMIPPAQEELTDYGLAPAIGYLPDTAAGVLRLAYSGVLEENPDMNVIAPHLGSYLLSAWDRIQSPRPDTVKQLPKALGDYLRGLYYDAVNLHRPMWDCALQTVDVSQIVFGSDYPFVPEGSTERGIALVNSLDITEQQRAAIFSGTADNILR